MPPLVVDRRIFWVRPGMVAWPERLVTSTSCMPLAFSSTPPLVVLAWVVTPGPTRPLPKAQEPVAVEVELTLPMQAEQAALAATLVAAVVAAGLRSTPWPRVRAASAALGWLSSFPMQSEEQNA